MRPSLQFILICTVFNACAALPCALVPIVPDSVYEVQVSTLSLTTYILLGVLIHLLLNIGYVYSSNVSFLPYNARLNTLAKKRKNNLISGEYVTEYLRLIFIIFLQSEEIASIIISFEYHHLDLYCLLLISSIINFNLSIVRISIHSVTYVALHHKEIF